LAAAVAAADPMLPGEGGEVGEAWASSGEEEAGGYVSWRWLNITARRRERFSRRCHLRVLLRRAPRRPFHQPHVCLHVAWRLGEEEEPPRLIDRQRPPQHHLDLGEWRHLPRCHGRRAPITPRSLSGRCIIRSLLCMRSVVSLLELSAFMVDGGTPISPPMSSARCSVSARSNSGTACSNSMAYGAWLGRSRTCAAACPTRP
jgi:hypothetical protein